jgi:hypothetical protein
MLLHLTQTVFFREIHLFLQPSWIGLIETKWAFLHLENRDLQEVFLLKTNLHLLGNNMADSAASNIDGFFGEMHMFPQLSWIGLCVANGVYIHLETLSWRKHFFQKLTQFWQRNNVLDAAASNKDCFPWRDACVSSTQLNRPIWNKMSLTPSENKDMQEVFL